MKNYYITTAIDYVNGKPHLGHAYEKIGADVYKRYKLQLGAKAYLLVGTDEHSINVQKKARELGEDPKAYCDRMALLFQELCQILNISYDRFIRTTDHDHKTVVEKIVDTLWNAGHIRKDTYSGLYCESCEAFLHNEQLIADHCPNHPTKKLVWVHEENYFFCLSNFQAEIEKYIDDNPDFIRPDIRRNEIINRVREGLKDISISRSSSDQWGIPFPYDSGHTVYVWFDALLNYLTGAGYFLDDQLFSSNWPPDVQIIGKDITWFHCVIWPSILLALGLPLPRQVFGHGFILHKGQKLSKTDGIIVDPFELVSQYSADVLRFYLMRVVPWGQDGNFSIDGLVTTYNNDLANDYGNVLSRTTAMINKFTKGTVSDPPECQSRNELKETAEDTLIRYHTQMERLYFSDALTEILSLVNKANRYIDTAAPWQLAASGDKEAELIQVLYNLVEIIRLTTWMLEPFMPSVKPRVWNQLGLTVSTLGVDSPSWGCKYNGIKINRGDPLFPRISS